MGFLSSLGRSLSNPFHGNPFKGAAKQFKRDVSHSKVGREALRDTSKFGKFAKNVHAADMAALRGKGLKAINAAAPGGKTEKKYAKVAGTIAAAYFTGGAASGLAGGGLGGAVAGGAAGGAVAGGLGNDDNRWKGAGRGALLGGAAGGAVYGAGQLAGAGSTGAAAGTTPSETGAYNPKTGLYDVAGTGEAGPASSVSEYPGGVGAVGAPSNQEFGNSGSGGVLGAGPVNSATGMSPVGSTAPSSITGSNSAGMPSSQIGSSAQLSAGQGPLGDAASGIGDTNTADYSLNSASNSPTATGHANTPLTSAPASGMSSNLATMGKFAAKYGLPIAALGTQLLRKPGIPQEGQLNDRYNTTNAQGEADLASARAGNISPSQRQQIATFKKDSDSALKQYMANSGQGMDSTSYLEMKQKIDQAGVAMEQGFVDQLFSQGLGELGLADSAQGTLINLRMQREQNTSNAMNQFMMTLGMMGAFA